MHESFDDLNQLADRARQGERGAARQLQDALQPQLRRIVRRILRTGDGDTPLGRRILAEAGPVRPVLEEELGQVAMRVCQSLVEQLGTPAVARDTVLG